MSACVVFLSSSEQHAFHYSMALLPSVAHTCHCSVALISLSQSSLLLLPAIAHWRDYVTQSQIQSLSLLQKQIHRNDPKFGCVVIMSGMTTIWVHMALLV